ncbi:MAG TPA: isocitrate lyase/PEP mutase family protein [Terriglobia bacterium]|nr:isocitrate lyase/PEP mutase family protein [Terriglobia bacterium]
MNRFVGTNKRSRKTWRKVLSEGAPLLLPVAHDALTARLIELAGYPAYQIGGFALVGSRFAYPDIDLAQFGENSAVMRDTIAASSLPVLVDADDAYGDAKNVTRVVQGYEAMGASAIFLEDQQAPKRCGHMLGKKVVPAEVHAGKIRAAVAARHDTETFIMARTDALAPLGLNEALRRAELYLEAGADGVYIEAVETAEQLQKVGERLRGVPLATSILEGGGRTPWMDPKELYALGYTMLLYPSTVIFRVTRAIQEAVADLKAGRPMPVEESVTFGEYEDIVGLPQWAALEDEFVGRHEHLGVPAPKANWSPVAGD